VQHNESGVHISEYFRVIRNRSGVVLTFFFIVTIIATVSSFMMKPVYRAATTLLVDLESPTVLAASGSVALGRTDYYAYKEYLQSQREIIKNRNITRQIYDEFKLSRSDDYKNAKDPIGKFRKTIKAGPIRDTRLLVLSVENKDPKLAAAISNRTAEIYVARNLDYITKNELLNLYKNEYLKLQTTLSEMSKIYLAKHPKMMRLREEIEQMTDKIKREKEQIGDYALAKAPSTIGPNTSRDLLSGLKANNITIQDRAEVPILPVKPKKRLNILLAMIIGLFGGVALAFMFEYLDDSIKGVGDIEKVVKWPYLGAIPRINKGGRLKESEKALFVQREPMSPIAEAYRTVRTSVLFSSIEEQPLQSIVITSPGPEEGKSVTTCNLGLTLAKNNNRVLLVDADMRKSCLHNIFKNASYAGLSDFLSGQAELEDVIQETDVENLYLVYAGDHPPNPSELLSSRMMKEFIKKTGSRFDYILFDSAPMAVVTDAAILSKQVDGTILVLESDRTSKRVLPRMNQILEDARARVVGFILNKASAYSSGYNCYTYEYPKKPVKSKA